MRAEDLAQLLRRLATKAKALNNDMNMRLNRNADVADYLAAFTIQARPQLEKLEQNQREHNNGGRGKGKR